MKHAVLAVMVGFCTLAFGQPTHAAACANGVYRAGCVGPHGAAVVHKVPPPRRHYPVTCAHGINRAGCAGPHGAVVVRKPY